MSIPSVTITDTNKFQVIDEMTFALMEAECVRFLKEKIRMATVDYPETVAQNEGMSIPVLTAALAGYQLSIKAKELDLGLKNPGEHRLGSSKMRERYLCKLQSLLYFPVAKIHSSVIRVLISKIELVLLSGNVTLDRWIELLNECNSDYLRQVSGLALRSVNNDKEARRASGRSKRLFGLESMLDVMDRDQHWQEYKNDLLYVASLIEENKIDLLFRCILCNPLTITATIVRETNLRTLVPVNLFTPPVLDYIQQNCTKLIRKCKVFMSEGDYLRSYLMRNQVALKSIIDSISESSNIANLEVIRDLKERIVEDEGLQLLDPSEDGSTGSSDQLRYEIQRAMAYQSAFSIQYEHGRGRRFITMPDEHDFITEDARLAAQLANQSSQEGFGVGDYSDIFQRHLIQRALKFNDIKHALVIIPRNMDHHIRFGDTLMKSVTTPKSQVRPTDRVMGLDDHPLSISFIVTIEPTVKALIFNYILDPLRQRLPGAKQ